MKNFSQLLSDRLIQSCSEAKAGLLKLCRMQMVVVKDKSALLIHFPNAWTKDRLDGFLLLGDLGELINNLGIEQLVMNDSERVLTYHQWDESKSYFDFKGYFLDGDLNKLELVNIPSIEELENLRGNQ